MNHQLAWRRHVCEPPVSMHNDCMGLVSCSCDTVQLYSFTGMQSHPWQFQVLVHQQVCACHASPIIIFTPNRGPWKSPLCARTSTGSPSVQPIASSSWLGACRCTHGCPEPLSGFFCNHVIAVHQDLSGQKHGHDQVWSVPEARKTDI